MLAVSRELLTNAARHSGASKVSLSLRRHAATALELVIADDGRGIASGRPAEALAEGHIGLASVNERVRAAGGQFELSTSPAGTRAVTRVPAAGTTRTAESS